MIAKEFLLPFLRSKKYSIPDAFEKIKQYCKLKNAKDTFASKISLEFMATDAYKQLLNQNKWNMCEIKSQEFSILFAKMEAESKPNIMEFIDLSMTMLLESTFADPSYSLKGYYIVFNCSQFSEDHVRKGTNDMYKIRFLQKLAYKYPVRIKKIFILFPTKPTQIFFNLSSAFLTQKMKDKITMAQSYEIIVNEFGTKNIPKDFGGSAPNIEELAEQHLGEVKMKLCSTWPQEYFQNV